MGRGRNCKKSQDTWVELGPRFMNSPTPGTRLTGIEGYTPETKFKENASFILCDLLNWVRHKYSGDLFSVASKNPWLREY